MKRDSEPEEDMQSTAGSVDAPFAAAEAEAELGAEEPVAASPTEVQDDNITFTVEETGGDAAEASPSSSRSDGIVKVVKDALSTASDSASSIETTQVLLYM